MAEELTFPFSVTADLRSKNARKEENDYIRTRSGLPEGTAGNVERNRQGTEHQKKAHAHGIHLDWGNWSFGRAEKEGLIEADEDNRWHLKEEEK